MDNEDSTEIAGITKAEIKAARKRKSRRPKKQVKVRKK